MRIGMLFVLLLNALFIACQYESQEQICEFSPRPMVTVGETVIISPWMLIQCVEKGEMCSCHRSDTTQMFDTIRVGSFMIDTQWTTFSSFNALMSGRVPYLTDLKGRCDDAPVFHINMYEAVFYCNIRSKHEGYDTVYSYTDIVDLGSSIITLSYLNVDTTKNGYRLPSRWEYEAAFQNGFIKKEPNNLGGWTVDYKNLPTVVRTSPCNPDYTRIPELTIDEPYIWPLGYPLHSYNRGDSTVTFTVVRSVQKQ